MELTKTYIPENTEDRWYSVWEQNGFFQPSSTNPTAPSYSIVIPPPNVTGSLHMGHALNNTLQDILIRWHRMQGQPTLWVPGTDHGGIATQNVVEKLIKTEKKTRHDLGREKFLERMWQWRKESGDTILMQLRRLGASCDWTRTRFTMDEVCSRAVREAFVRLFNKGLIYRGPRMVNWCPRCQTALSDIEVEHEERAGNLWHIRYPYTDGKSFVIVATTRPETMLGDTAVAVNPEDLRYKASLGKKLHLPLMNRNIPLVSDEAVDAAFGTGAVKVTPAHDLTDFEIGARHKLAQVVVIGFDGKMTAEAGPYAGVDRFEARKRIVADLEAQGLLEKTEDYKLSAAVCYRCQTLVEPLVSEQWFLKVGEMAGRTAEATRQGKVRIYPQSWEKPYLLWLENIKDWCISRQIWWGHRIPVYYCAKGHPGFASVEQPKQCPECGSSELRQDEDVLDTWFSSGLWPISVFGWPDPTSDLKRFYPTSVLVTGHEILYLWVARMVMFGLEFMNEIPFHHVYIHGIVRDKHGKKMSKSLGNVIDPLGIMKQYGTDALRFSLAESSIPGRDLQLSNDSFLKARNFANKLWNASRFVMMNLTDYKQVPLAPASELMPADRWILSELQSTIEQVTGALRNYNPAEAARSLYEFTWGSFCDWYVEMAKIPLTGTDPAAKQKTQTVLVHVLEETLRLLHPIMPYETEEIFQALEDTLGQKKGLVMVQPWPQPDKTRQDDTAVRRMNRFQQVTTAIRTIRSEVNVPPGKKIACHIKTADPDLTKILRDMEPLLFFLARLDKLEVGAHQERPPESAVSVVDGAEIYLPLKDLVDVEKEKQRLNKTMEQLLSAISRDRAIYDNADFRRRAPEEEVERLKLRLDQAQTKVALLERNLKGL